MITDRHGLQDQALGYTSPKAAILIRQEEATGLNVLDSAGHGGFIGRTQKE